jgi:hypothetical protein
LFGKMLRVSAREYLRRKAFGRRMRGSIFAMARHTYIKVLIATNAARTPRKAGCEGSAAVDGPVNVDIM